MEKNPDEILLIKSIAQREVLTGLIAMFARQSGDPKLFVTALKAQIDGTRSEVLAAGASTPQHHQMAADVGEEVDRIFKVFGK